MTSETQEPETSAIPDKNRPLGVIVVMYQAADVIAQCLNSLLDQSEHFGSIVLVDNGSPDRSAAVVREVLEHRQIHLTEHSGAEVAGGDLSTAGVHLIRSGNNRGFAGGVNHGLKFLLSTSDVRHFWILNPDCELMPGSAELVLETAENLERGDGYSLLGTRILYHEAKACIQSDGGVYSRWTGRCRNLNQGQDPDSLQDAPLEDGDFISGASMVASRRFITESGLMPEHYFLYYEEVDWARRRGALPLYRCRDAIVKHHGGTAIGSGSITRSPSAFSNYFNFRNRVRFMRKHHPFALPFCYGFSVLKIVQILLRDGSGQAHAALSGTFGLPPPRAVVDLIREDDRAMAFQNVTGSKMRPQAVSAMPESA